MSKTDKDRPYHVRIRDTGLVDHDHRHGVCIIDDDRRNRWGAWRHHWSHCAKRVEIVEYCTKEDAKRLSRCWDGSYAARRGVLHDYLGRTCWTWVCGCNNIPAEWRNETHGDCRRVRVGCIGHTRIERREEIPCACDDSGPQPTCFPAEDPAERWSMFGGGGVPDWFVRSVWHGPERRRERNGLRAAARAWNAGDDLDEYDFENRQARNSARWVWH